MNLVDRVGTLDMFIDMQLRTIKEAKGFDRVICSSELVSFNTASIQES